MKRPLLSALAAMVVIPILAVVALVAWVVAIDGDLTSHRDFIGRQVGRALHRPVAITGILRLTLSAQPVLTVTGLSIGNAPWGQAHQMLTVKRLEMRSELLPLLQGRAVLTRLAVEGAAAAIEIDAQGRRNWALDDRSPQSKGFRILGLSQNSALDMRVEDSTVAYRDAESGREWTLNVNRGAIRSDDLEAPVTFALQSTWAGVPLRAKGSAGPLSALRRGTEPYPFDLTGELLGIRYSATGEIPPGRLADVRLTLQAQAESLDAARALFAEVIPPATPLQLALTVSGSQTETSAQLDASIGAGRVKGELDLKVGGQRPLLGGRITLDRFDLRAWITGLAKFSSTTNASTGEHHTTFAVPPDLDAAIDLQARQIVLPSLTAANLDGRLVLEKGQLAIEHVELAAKPMGISGRIAVDTGSSPPNLRVALAAPRIDAAWLSGGKMEGTLSGNAELKLQGLGPAAWAQSGRGRIEAQLIGATQGDKMRIVLRRAEGRNVHAELNAEGQWNGKSVKLNGKVGTPADWLSAGRPIPIELYASLNDISANVTGTIAELVPMKGVTLVVSAQAPTLQDVGALWGISLAPDGPVRLASRVSGGSGAWELSELEGSMGPTRVAGRLGIRTGDQRSKVEGQLTLTDAKLKSLLPLSGATTPVDENRAKAGQLFPTTPLAFPDLSAFDATIALAGTRLDLGYLSLPEFTGNLELGDARLRLQLDGNAGRDRNQRVDFEADNARAVPTLRLRVQDPDAEAANLLGDSAAAGLLTGRVAVDLDLRGHGESIAAILASLDGQAHLLMGQGTVNTTSLDRLVVDVQTLFNSLLGTDRTTQNLHCAYVDLTASTGVFQGAALLDTETSSFLLDGKIDLAQETVALNGTPLQKGLIRLATLVPVRLTGSLSNPKAEIQKTATLFRLGMLVAKLNPATALPAFGLSALEEIAQGNPCVEQIRTAAEKDH